MSWRERSVKVPALGLGPQMASRWRHVDINGSAIDSVPGRVLVLLGDTVQPV